MEHLSKCLLNDREKLVDCRVLQLVSTDRKQKEKKNVFFYSMYDKQQFIQFGWSQLEITSNNSDSIWQDMFLSVRKIYVSVHSSTQLVEKLISYNSLKGLP